ncbi:MAG: hypothetical protein PVH77_12130, partial [Phycisphaerales bacterium]
MSITTIVAKILGSILLLLSLFFIAAGRICFRQFSENLEFWLERTLEEVQKRMAGSIIHREIFRTFRGLSISRDYIYQNLEMESCEEFDNFHSRITDAIRITTYRWCILPFIVGGGLILSGSLWWILVLPIAWIVTFDKFCRFAVHVLLLVGWLYGGLIFSYSPSTSK